MKRILVALTLVSLFALGLGAVQAQGSQPSVRTIPVESKASMISLSPDDHTLAVYNLYALYDEAPSADLVAITLIDLATGEKIGTLSGYPDWVTGVAFNSDGSQLASMHRNGDLIVWDVATRKMIRTIMTPALGGSPIQFLSDDKTILMRVGVFWLGTVDSESGAITHLFGRHIDTYQEFSDEYTEYPKRGDIGFAGFAASPDGQWVVASTENDEVLVWDIQSGEMVTLRPPGEKFGRFSIRSFVFSRDGSQLVYFDQSDKKTHIWDVAKRSEIGAFDLGATSFALAPDGKQIAWVDRASNTVSLADMSSSDAPVTLAELPDATKVQPITNVAFTSDGKQIVVGGLYAVDGDNQIYVITLAA